MARKHKKLTDQEVREIYALPLPFETLNLGEVLS